MTIGEKLTNLRILHNLPIQEVSRYTGIPTRTIMQLETDVKEPKDSSDWKLLKELVHFYNASLTDVANRELSLKEITNSFSFLTDVTQLVDAREALDDLPSGLTPKNQLRFFMDRYNLSAQDIDEAAHLTEDANTEKLLAHVYTFGAGKYAHSYYRIAKALSLPIDFFDVLKPNANLFCETDSTYIYKPDSEDNTTMSTDNITTNTDEEISNDLEDIISSEEPNEDVPSTEDNDIPIKEPATATRSLPEGFDSMAPKERLRALRQSMNLTRADVSARTNHQLSKGIINNLETGKTKITQERLDILARLYEVVPETIVGDAPVPPTPHNTSTRKRRRPGYRVPRSRKPVDTSPATPTTEPAKAPSPPPPVNTASNNASPTPRMTVRGLLRGLSQVFDLIDELSARNDYTRADADDLKATLEAMKNDERRAE